MGHDNASVFGILIGALVGFLAAMLYEWGMLNLVVNIYETFNIIIMITFILFFVTLILAIWFLSRKSWKAGMFFLLFSFKILNWLIQFYLPIITGDGIYTFSWWFFWW